jgi:hypothetical protein
MFVFSKRVNEKIVAIVQIKWPENSKNKKEIVTKPFVFHGTKKKNLESITRQGLYPSNGVYGTFVYTKLTPNKTLYDHLGTDSIVIIDILDYLKYANKENEPFVYDRKKDWVLFPETIKKSSILAIIEFKEKDGQIEPVLYPSQNKICEKHYIIESDKDVDKLFNKKVNDLAMELFKSKYGDYFKVKLEIKEYKPYIF